MADELLSKSRAPGRASSAANLNAIEEADASGEVADLYERFRSHFGRPNVPGIVKCFATHPPLLRHMMGLAESMLFIDGCLIRRHKEMIATLVSAQNACAYCADSHGYHLRMQGGSAEALCAIQANDLHSIALSEEERALLGFVEKVNRSSHQINRADIDALIRAGWSESQIAEAVHIAALFASFNRIVNAFGLESQGLLDLYESQTAADRARAAKPEADAR